MKTIRLIIAAAVCAAVISCQKDNITGSQANADTEQAVISTEVMTKTSLNGNEIHWTNDDVIAVFDNTNTKNEFTLTKTEGSQADFTGSVTSGSTQLYTVYPYDLAVSAEGSILKVNVLADQTSKAGSFAEEHNISVAKAEKTPGVTEVSGVTFKNACALLKFTVPSYISDVKKVTVSSNTAMAGEMTIDYSGDTPVCTLSENGTKSISMTGSYEAGSTFWFVLAPVTLDGITVKVETEKGVYYMSTDSKFEMTAGKYRNLGTLNLEKATVMEASAAHTYSSNGTLTGTKVTVTLDLPETTAKYITNLTLQVKNAAGTVVRTLNKNVASATEVISANDQWPYLPKGTYTVSGSYTLSGVTEKEIETFAFTITESPVFKINSVTAYTSYSKYLAGDKTGANSLDGHTIYDVKAGVTVSDAILNNSNYPSLVITDNGVTVNSGNITGRTCGKHTIKASYTLDGITVENSTDVHITGLPYSYTFYESSTENVDAAGWTRNGNTGYQSKLLWLSNNALGNKYGWVATPAIYVPSNTTINTSIKLVTKFYNAVLFSPKTMTVYLGVTSDRTKSDKSKQGSCKGSNNTSSTKDLRTINASMEIPSGINYISIDHNNTTAMASYFYLYSYECLYN